MNQSTTSSLRKMAVGAVVALGATIVLASSACTVTTNVCTPDLGTCAIDSDCCSNICAGDGLCGCVGTSQTGCAVDSDCCSGSDICVQGACVPGGACLNDGSACSVDTDCCTSVCSQGDFTCGCVPNLTTGCAIDSDCCNASDSCVGGVCQ
jgi:hypothetical protein